MTYYKLRKGDAVTTSWIPERFAKKGKCLKLRDNDEWVDGWLVIDVGDARQPEEIVVARSQDYRRQRRATDI